MKRNRLCAFVVAAFGVIFGCGMAFAGANISLLASNFSRTEQYTTNDTTAPLTIYDNIVKVPASNNVLLVTISGGSDVNGALGATSLLLNCQVDGADCASASGSSTAAPAGWTNLNISQSGLDSEDSSVSYTWCTPISRLGRGKSGLQHEVTLNMASSNNSDYVNLEAIHVSIEAAKVQDGSNACSGAGFP